jgi:carbon monoxide dehydrogenase subunit G
VARVVVSTLIDAPPAEVWADVSDISSHVEWMQDAVAIRFTSESEFDCDTRVGPFRLTDHMVITEWEEGGVIGIRHVGLVSGSGRFTLVAEGEGTRFTWSEELRFPWFLGGPAGAYVAAPILRRIWRGNLHRLSRRLAR